MKYKNTTFVNILLIYSHYKPGKPFLKGGLLFFWQPPVGWGTKLASRTLGAHCFQLSGVYL